MINVAQPPGIMVRLVLLVVCVLALSAVLAQRRPKGGRRLALRGTYLSQYPNIDLMIGQIPLRSPFFLGRLALRGTYPDIPTLI